MVSSLTKTQLARMLGIGRTTLYRKLRRYKKED
ncbi:helix-turn-helix domain-containing protein [Desulfotomaculum copahuensis]